MVSFSWLYECGKELKVCSIVSFSWFYKHRKELKVISFGENQWLHDMKLSSKHVELTYVNQMQG
jgi:hypothetical protein